jgi:hypothetical protein
VAPKSWTPPEAMVRFARHRRAIIPRDVTEPHRGETLMGTFGSLEVSDRLKHLAVSMIYGCTISAPENGLGCLEMTVLVRMGRYTARKEYPHRVTLRGTDPFPLDL